MTWSIRRLAARFTAIILAALLVIGPQLMVSGMASAGAGQSSQSQHHHQHQTESGTHQHGAQGDCCDLCAGCPTCLVVPTVSWRPSPAIPLNARIPGLDGPAFVAILADHRLPFPVGPPSLSA
jgi:hypothetical protein